MTDENNPWRCAGCGKKADGLISTCNCPTMVGCRDGMKGFRESTWLVTREQHEREVLERAAPDMLSALRLAKRLTDNINEFGKCTDAGLYDAAWIAIEAALAKVEASS